MNTSSTVGAFTYVCEQCRANPRRKLSWGPWRMCCRVEAQGRNRTERLVEVEPTKTASSKIQITPRTFDEKKSKKKNMLGPFMTNQKTTCGALWNWDEGMSEHRKESLGIPPADVYAWGENYAKTARAN